MRIAITGSTGFVGGHAAAAAIEADHAVTALVRDADRLRRSMQALGVGVPEFVVGDMTDPDAVSAVLDGADAVVHAAAVVSMDRRRRDEMLGSSLAGTRNVLEQAADCGLDPIVHVSSTSALFQPGAGPLTAGHLPASVHQAYAASKAGAEAIARDLQAQGAPVAIVYPSGVVGPPAGDAFGETATEMARFVAGGVMPTRDASLSLIDVRDLAMVLVAAIEPGLGPRRIMCGGHLLDMERLAEILRELTGRRFPIAPVPSAALRAVGRGLDWIRRVVPFETSMTGEAMALVTRWEGTVDSDLVALGVHLRDPERSFADSLPAWREAGLLSDRQLGDPTARTTRTGDDKPPAPPGGFRLPSRVLMSRPFRAVAPRILPPVHRSISRATGGRTLLDSRNQPMLILATTGARTGNRRETPLASVPLEAGRFLVVGSNFAREGHPAWTANLLAEPDAEVLFRGVRTPVRARLLDGDERAARWQTALEWYPLWADYDRATTRELRLFELVPTGDVA